MAKTDHTEKLLDYMIELNHNQDLLDKHNADPGGTAKAYGLSPGDVHMISKGQYDEIKARLEAHQVAKVEFIITFHSED